MKKYARCSYRLKSKITLRINSYIGIFFPEWFKIHCVHVVIWQIYCRRGVKHEYIHIYIYIYLFEVSLNLVRFMNLRCFSRISVHAKQSTEFNVSFVTRSLTYVIVLVACVLRPEMNLFFFLLIFQ